MQWIDLLYIYSGNIVHRCHARLLFISCRFFYVFSQKADE